LNTGPHVIEIGRRGSSPWRATVVVRNGDRTEINPELEAEAVEETRPSAIQVSPQPPHAQITVDGKPVHAREVFQVPPGRHEIQIRARGWRSYWRAIDLGVGETLKVDLRLQRRGEDAFLSGAIFTALALGAEAVALVGYASANRELANSSDYNTWHAVELGGHITAGIFGFGALISYIAGIVQVSTEGSERAARLDAEVGPGGASLKVSGRF
jgi:hypothetical protein